MKKRRHLTVQIMLMICILAAAAVLVCWIINSIFLENYYVRQKLSTMVLDFEVMEDASAENLLQSEEFNATFDFICDNDNMTILTITPEGQLVRTSAADMSSLQEELYTLVRDVNQSEVVSEGWDYQILSTQDTRLNSEYLVLVGELPNGELILMRTALESIRESATLSNRLLLIVGLITIGVSLFVGWLLARRVTRPILQLTGISKQMVGLDFEAKYVHGAWKKDPDLRIGPSHREKDSDADKENIVAGNEIDQLGENMNHLSETLESTISELKSANLSLTKDIEQKTQIDEMRKEFLSNVSHELKTPLALIQGYAEGLHEFGDDPENREYYCDVIVDEAGKMNGLVQQLLSLNQLEFGEDQAVMERFDITELILGVCGASRILMDKQGITLDVSGIDSQYVWGDPFKVESAITNYLSNAIHYCSGEKRIRIFYTRRDDLLRVSVFNTGQPIPEEDLDQVWDKFYKVDKARTREYGGSGIGLSIVKAVMDSHGQECGVINHEDGVEFWLELATK